MASGILISTRLPAAKAAVAAMTARTTGPFHGTAMPTTPNGWACTVVRRPSGLPPSSPTAVSSTGPGCGGCARNR